MSIITKNLTKVYKGNNGCKDINIVVQQGEIFGFLGPNGAGKSTFVKTLVGLLFPTSGQAYLLGEPLGNIEVRRKIGYVPENFKYQEWMTGEELLNFHGALYKMPKKQLKSVIPEVLEMVNLQGREKDKIATYSKGMQQRLGIAGALISDPSLIFLDEPTSALDPIGRKDIRDIMLLLKNRRKTIFLNSHLLSEIEMVCDSVAVINKGKIVKQGTLEDVIGTENILEIRVDNVSDSLKSALPAFGKNIEISNNTIKMNVASDDRIPEISKLIVQSGISLYEIKIIKESLENVFIDLISGGDDKCGL